MSRKGGAMQSTEQDNLEMRPSHLFPPLFRPDTKPCGLNFLGILNLPSHLHCHFLHSCLVTSCQGHYTRLLTLPLTPPAVCDPNCSHLKPYMTCHSLSLISHPLSADPLTLLTCHSVGIGGGKPIWTGCAFFLVIEYMIKIGRCAYQTPKERQVSEW